MTLHHFCWIIKTYN